MRFCFLILIAALISCAEKSLLESKQRPVEKIMMRDIIRAGTYRTEIKNEEI
jgi:hypothetical protein